MKHNIFFIAALFLLASSCKKTADNSVTTQPNSNSNNTGNSNLSELVYTKKTSPVFFDFTSTGCPGCGSWGKPTFYSVIKSQPEITPLAVHIKYGDPMITDESNAIAANRYGDIFTPQLWIGDSNAVLLNGGFISGQQSIDRINKLISEAKTQTQPSIAALIQKNGNSWKVKFGASFTDINPDGEYSLACYLTEDGIEANQTSSASNPTIHNHVIRASAGGAFGKSFDKTTLNAKSEISFEHSFELSEKYKAENTYLTVVLWKKAGARYISLNGYTLK